MGKKHLRSTASKFLCMALSVAMVTESGRGRFRG